MKKGVLITGFLMLSIMSVFGEILWDGVGSVELKGNGGVTFEDTESTEDYYEWTVGFWIKLDLADFEYDTYYSLFEMNAVQTHEADSTGYICFSIAKLHYTDPYTGQDIDSYLIRGENVDRDGAVNYGITEDYIAPLNNQWVYFTFFRRKNPDSTIPSWDQIVFANGDMSFHNINIYTDRKQIYGIKSMGEHTVEYANLKAPLDLRGKIVLAQMLPSVTVSVRNVDSMMTQLMPTGQEASFYSAYFGNSIWKDLRGTRNGRLSGSAAWVLDFPPLLPHSTEWRHINYQGYLLDEQMDPVEGKRQAILSVIDSEDEEIWHCLEPQPVLFDTDGLFNTAFEGSLVGLTAKANTNQLYYALQVQVTNEVYEAVLPVQPVVSVPYAFSVDRVYEANNLNVASNIQVAGNSVIRLLDVETGLYAEVLEAESVSAPVMAVTEALQSTNVIDVNSKVVCEGRLRIDANISGMYGDEETVRVHLESGNWTEASSDGFLSLPVINNFVDMPDGWLEHKAQCVEAICVTTMDPKMGTSRKKNPDDFLQLDAATYGRLYTIKLLEIERSGFFVPIRKGMQYAFLVKYRDKDYKWHTTSPYRLGGNYYDFEQGRFIPLGAAEER